MEHQVAIDFLIMVSLVLGIGNTYYIAKYLIRTGFFKDSQKAPKNADKSKNIKN